MLAKTCKREQSLLVAWGLDESSQWAAETGADARLGKRGRRNQSEHNVLEMSVCLIQDSATETCLLFEPEQEEGGRIGREELQRCQNGNEDGNAAIASRPGGGAPPELSVSYLLRRLRLLGHMGGWRSRR